MIPTTASATLKTSHFCRRVEIGWDGSRSLRPVTVPSRIPPRLRRIDDGRIIGHLLKLPQWPARQLILTARAVGLADFRCDQRFSASCLSTIGDDVRVNVTLK